jgi:RimJ/RimL family protein N-acetyltransferase
LTFIVCQPLPDSVSDPKHVDGGKVDSPDRMVGDINFFIYPSDDDSEESSNLYEGEVDIMIADEANRSKGFGRAAVTALLYYIARHSEAIMGEYLKGVQPPAAAGQLVLIMARIKAENVGSIALFRNLGFEQQGEVNYFGEIKMVLSEEQFAKLAEKIPEGYAEVEYRRPDL